MFFKMFIQHQGKIYTYFS